MQVSPRKLRPEDSETGTSYGANREDSKKKPQKIGAARPGRKGGYQHNRPLIPEKGFLQRLVVLLILPPLPPPAGAIPKSLER